MDPEPLLILSSFLLSPLVVGIIVITILLILSAIISGTEVAFFSLSKQAIESCKDNNLPKGLLIEQLMADSKKLLATILVANNFINVGIVLVFAIIKDDLFFAITLDWVRWVIEVVVITFFILLFGEILPKIYANRNAQKFVETFVYFINYLNIFLTFISLPLTKTSDLLRGILGSKKHTLSVDKLSQALDLTSDDETSNEEKKILEGIVTFGNTEASQIMSPRVDMFALEMNTPYEEVLSLITDKGFSRIPVYEDSLDQIKGVLYIKDLIPHLGKLKFDWPTLIRETLFVPENKKLDDLLKEFKSIKNHMAIVVDEFGGTSGIITLEDIIEEIVGDISDEFDDTELNYSKIDDHNYIFDAKTNLKDFYRLLNLNDEVFETKKGDAETLAGFILELNASLPKKGQMIIFDAYTFTIEAVDNKRIKSIKITING